MKEKRKIINIHNNIARKHGKVTVKDLQKYEKLRYEKNKLKLDIDFLNNCKKPSVYPKFLIFRLPNVSKKMVHQFVKDSFLAPSRNVIKNFKMFQKNSVYLKSRNHCKNC